MKEGLITKDDLKVAEVAAQRENESLNKILVKLGFVTKEELAMFVGETINIPYVNINNYTIERSVLDLIPEKIARRYKIIPLFKIENILTIAMSDPLNIIALDDISKLAKCKTETVIASEENVNLAIEKWYGTGEVRKSLIEELAEELKQTNIEMDEDAKSPDRTIEEQLRIEASEAPITKLFNSFIVQAVLENASDIHLEPKRGFMQVRFRIDGFLYNRHKIPERLVAPLTSRIKIMSGLDISKRRIPQDGRIGIIIRDRSIDIRTSTFPSMYEENVVLRV